MLTQARYEVMLCTMAGLTARETAVLLQKSVSTVRTQRSQVIAVLGAKNSVGAVAVCIEPKGDR